MKNQQLNPQDRETLDVSPYESIGRQVEARDGSSLTHRSPLQFLIITIAAIFAAEVVAMIVVYFLPQPIPYYQTTLIDAVIMTVLIFPALYVFSFRPLIRQMEKSRRAEGSLLHARELQEKFFDSIDTLIAYMDRDFNFIRVNDAYARSSGRLVGDFTGRNHFHLYPHPENEAIFRQVVTTGEAYIAHEKPFEYPDQPERGVTYWNWSLQPVKDGGGTVDGLVLSLVDVTERKRAEEDLRKAYDQLELRVQERTEELRVANAELKAEIHVREDAEAALRMSEHRLNRAQEIAHLGSWELDLEANRLAWSDEVYRIFGAQPQEFAASYEAFLDFVHPDDRAAVDEAYSRSVRDGRAGYEIEHRLIRWDSGETRTVHEKCEHFRDGHGKIVRSVGMVHDITERKQAEEQLRYQAALLANVNDAIVASDAEFHITAWNSAAEALYGWKREEVLGRSGLEIVQTAWPEIDATEMRRTIAATGRWRGEATQVRKDGTRFPVEVSSLVLRTPDGQVAGYISVNRDITQRKQAEEALQRSEALLTQTGQMAKVGGWELDVLAGRLVWSAETCRIHEVDLSFEPRVDTAIQFYAPESQPLIRNAVQLAREEGQPYDLELELITAKGNRIWIRTIGQAEFCQGKCVRLFGAIQDISERKQAQEALRKAYEGLEQRVRERTGELAAANRDLVREIAERREVESQLRIRTTAMEAAGGGILITDRQGNILWTNPALTRISGYEAGDLTGKNMRIFRSGQHDPAYYARLWTTILAGKVWRDEIVNRRKDGELYFEEETITPVQTEQGEITHFIAIKQDITERKKDEADLERQNIELQNLSKSEHYQRQFSEALVSAALVLNKSLKLDEVLALILEEVRGVIPYQLADITLLDSKAPHDKSHHAEPMGYSSLAGTYDLSRMIRSPLLDRARRSGEPLLLADTHYESEWVAPDRMAWVRSVLSAPLLAEKNVIGFLSLFSDQSAFFTEEMSNRLVAFAAHASVAIQNAWLFAQVQASTERLQSLSRRLVEIQENERLYISRELHDEAGQVLTSLLVDLRLLEKNAKQSGVILKIVAEMEGSLNRVIENLHRIAMALRPASLDHVGLVTALRQHVESIGEKHNLRVSFSASQAVVRLSTNIETVIYRVVQEALTNTVRHARATHVDVILTLRDGRLVVIIEDDGIGFDPDDVTSDAHLGLFGMRERTEMIGGTLTIESTPGNGTSVILEVSYADTTVGRG